MNFLEIKNAFPYWEGFLFHNKENKFETISKTKPNNRLSWFKIKVSEEKELSKKDIYKIIENFYQTYNYDTGVDKIKSEVSEYVTNFKLESYNTKLKQILQKEFYKINLGKKFKAQLGVFQDSFYTMGKEYFVIYLGIIVGIIHEDDEDFGRVSFSISELIGDTPKDKRRTVEKLSLKEMINIISSKINKLEKNIEVE